MTNATALGLRGRLRAVLEERLALNAPARRLRLTLTERIVAGWGGARRLRVLDAGCGDGLLSLALARRHPAWEIVGLDLRPDLLEGATARARARELGNVRFEAADLTRPLPRAGFDAVLAIECLSEIPDDAAALRSLAMAVAPGGLLVVQVPDRAWRAWLPWAPSTWREQVRQGYDAAQLAGMLSDAGTEVCEIRPTFRATAAVAQEVRDRLKTAALTVRCALFPVLTGAAWLEAHGVTGGRSSAFIGVARRPGPAAEADGRAAPAPGPATAPGGEGRSSAA